TKEAAIHNLRQLLAAGLENNLYDRPERELNKKQRALLDEMAHISYRAYQEFKSHPLFLPYLQEMSTLNYYAQSNIGSRPSKRGGDSELKFEDLRAIPFVGAWGQLKQNVPGYYGFGTALRELERAGKLQDCQDLYQKSRFFRALLDNSMQSMCKTNFQLTAHMAEHPKFGQFWQLIRDEFELSKAMTLQVAGQSMLLEDNPSSRLSIDLRQRVVLPLLVIQQYALMELQSADKKETARFEKMVIRSMFGNINASRNSA
ncbi:MAG: phosphoenolpyruvate carboxylase, partial [Gammaproteobacteria bacterium]